MNLTLPKINLAKGANLDALVAEHLFGWRWYTIPEEMRHGAPSMRGMWPPQENGNTLNNWSPAFSDVTDSEDCEAIPRFADWDKLGHTPIWPDGVPPFSNDWNCMMELLTKMNRLGFQWRYTGRNVCFIAGHGENITMEPFQNVSITLLPAYTAKAALKVLLATKK